MKVMQGNVSYGMSDVRKPGAHHRSWIVSGVVPRLSHTSNPSFLTLDFKATVNIKHTFKIRCKRTAFYIKTSSRFSDVDVKYQTLLVL